MQDSCRALETEPSPNKLRGNDADHDEEYDNNDDDHDDDNNDADLAGDSPKEPAAKDRVGHVQRKNSHRDLAHKTFSFSLMGTWHTKLSLSLCSSFCSMLGLFLFRTLPSHQSQLKKL